MRRGRRPRSSAVAPAWRRAPGRARSGAPGAGRYNVRSWSYFRRVFRRTRAVAHLAMFRFQVFRKQGCSLGFPAPPQRRKGVRRKAGSRRACSPGSCSIPAIHILHLAAHLGGTANAIVNSATTGKAGELRCHTGVAVRPHTLMCAHIAARDFDEKIGDSDGRSHVI